MGPSTLFVPSKTSTVSALAFETVPPKM